MSLPIPFCLFSMLLLSFQRCSLRPFLIMIFFLLIFVSCDFFFCLRYLSFSFLTISSFHTYTARRDYDRKLCINAFFLSLYFSLVMEDEKLRKKNNWNLAPRWKYYFSFISSHVLFHETFAFLLSFLFFSLQGERSRRRIVRGGGGGEGA